MTKDIEIYFDHHSKEARVYVTKDGTFFPEKNKQDAIRHQQSIKEPVEAIKEVVNPSFEGTSEEEATAGDFLNNELEEVKKELEEKEGLLTIAKDDLEAAEKELEAKQNDLKAVETSIADKGNELTKVSENLETVGKDLEAKQDDLKALEESIVAKGKELKDLEAKLAKAKKETK